MTSVTCGMDARANSPIVSTKLRHWAAHPIVLCATCSLITAFVYLGVINGGFCWDDRPIIVNNDRALDEWADMVRAFSVPQATGTVAYYRPVLVATLVLDRQLAGKGPRGFHRTNLILHCLNVAMVWALLFAYTRHRLGATLGALLFSLHPIQTHAVALIAGRHDLLLVPPLAGLLLAYRSWAHSRGLPGIVFHGAMLALYAIALWTKETALVFPGIIFLADTFVPPWPKPPLRSRCVLQLSLAVVAVAYLLVRWHIFGTPVGGDQYGNPSAWQRVLMAIATYGYYLQHIVLPFGLSATPFYARLVDPAGVAFVQAALVCIGCALALLWARRRRPLVAFGIGLFLLCVLPVAGFVPMRVYMLEPRTYAAMIGLAVCAAALLDGRPIHPHVLGAPHAANALDSGRRRLPVAGVWRRHWRAAALATLLLAYAVATIRRVPQYRDDLSLWSATAAAVPESAYARNSYGFTLMEARRDTEALSEFRESVRLDADDVNARYNFAWLLERAGNRIEAIANLRELLRRHPGDPVAVNSLGVFLLRSGQLEEAQSVLTTALETSRNDPKLLFNLGNVFEARRKFDDAVQTYQRLTKMAPRNPQYWESLGRVLSKAERYPEAATAFERTLAIGPDTGALHFALGSALWRSGRGPQALVHAQRAQQLGYTDRRLLDELTQAGFLGH